MAINLLPQQLQIEKSQSNRKIIVNAISFIILVILVVSVAVIFSYRVVVTRSYNEMSTQLTQLKKQISDRKKEEWYLTQIHNKSNVINTFISSQSEYAGILEEIKSIARNTNNIDSVQADISNNVSLKGKSESLLVFADFLSRLNNNQTLFKNIRISKLGLNSLNYFYDWGINLEIVTKEIK